MIKDLPRRSPTVLGLLVIAVLPMVVALTVHNHLSWFSGAVLFYGILAVTEIGYLMILVATTRWRKQQSVALLP